MKIVLALGWYFPESLGGTEIYVRSLARRLVDDGHDVHIVAPRAGADGLEEYLHDNVQVIRYPVPVDPTRSEVQSDIVARGAMLLHEFLSGWRPDIFHVHSLVTGLGLHELRAARLAGAHVVYTNHLPSMGFVCARGTLLRDGHTACDGLQEETRCGACLLQQRDVPAGAARGIAALPAPLARTLSWIPGAAGTALGIRELVRNAANKQQQLLELADCVVVLNDWAASIFRANGAPANKVIVNRLGVSHPDLSEKPSAGERPTPTPVTVGYVGRLHEVKGLNVLADAVRMVPESLPLRLVVAGPADDPDARSVLAEFTRRIGSNSRVTIIGAVDPSRMGEHLRALDVLCCPSLWFENGPTIALEAVAVGTPVIGTRLGAFLELVEDGVNGRLVPPGDAGALANVLADVATRPRDTVDRWRAALPATRTMRQVATDYQSLYRRLVAASLANH